MNLRKQTSQVPTMLKHASPGITLQELELAKANSENEDPRSMREAKETKLRTPSEQKCAKRRGGEGSTPTSPDMSWMEPFRQRSHERMSSQSRKKRIKRARSSAKRRRAISGARDLDIAVSFADSQTVTASQTVTEASASTTTEPATKVSLGPVLPPTMTPPELRLRRSAQSTFKGCEGQDEDHEGRFNSRDGGGVLRPSAALKYVGLPFVGQNASLCVPNLLPRFVTARIGTTMP